MGRTQHPAVIKAAGSGRRAPAARPGELRGWSRSTLRKFPDCFHPAPGRQGAHPSSGQAGQRTGSSLASVSPNWLRQASQLRLAPAAPVPGGLPGLGAAGTGKTAELRRLHVGSAARRGACCGRSFSRAFPEPRLRPNKVLSGRRYGRLGVWWPPACEHFLLLGFESC